MPSFLQVLMILHAISPRFAINTRLMLPRELISRSKVLSGIFSTVVEDDEAIECFADIVSVVALFIGPLLTLKTFGMPNTCDSMSRACVPGCSRYTEWLPGKRSATSVRGIPPQGPPPRPLFTYGNQTIIRLILNAWALLYH